MFFNKNKSSVYKPETKDLPWENLRPIDLNKISVLDFPSSEYFAEEYNKFIIVLHHTVSGPGQRGDIITWKKYKSRIAAHFIIARDGTPYQLYNSKYWGWHLGVGNSYLDKHSIAIEIDNWGFLNKRNNEFYTTYGNKVDTKVIKYPNKFRGHKYYEAYTNEQIKTVGELALYFNQKYNIPLTYNDDMWDVSQRALNGAWGIWTHVSYRPASEKTDCHPQPNLKEMLFILNDIKYNES